MLQAKDQVQVEINGTIYYAVVVAIVGLQYQVDLVRDRNGNPIQPNLWNQYPRKLIKREQIIQDEQRARRALYY